MVFHDNIQFETCFLFHKKKKGNNFIYAQYFPNKAVVFTWYLF